MKKAALIALTLIVIIAVSATAGTYILTQQSKPQTGTKLNVIATFYPLYDFAQNVGGDKVTVSILVPETVDVHDFEPTPSSISAVSTADVLIYNGAGLEPWISSIVSASENPDLVQVDTSQGITLLPVAQQFQGGNQTYDPHFWLNPVDVQQQVRNILRGFILADPAESEYFTQNADAYIAKLDALNLEAINATTNTASTHFVTFHESFAYFAKQYNITQVPILGPFQEEPSAGDIQAVIEAIHQYGLRYVGYESLENPAISQSISTQTNASLIEMNPIEGLTDAQKTAGDNYITLMQKVIENIHLALTNIDTT